VINLAASGLYVGDCRELLKQLPDGCIQTCVTSPPYWGLRDYGVDGQIGLEKTPEEYVETIVDVFNEVRRVLTDDATLWLNIGDTYARGKNGRSDEDETSLRRRNRSYGTALHGKTGERGRQGHGRQVPSGLKPKDLIGIPWMVAFALRAAGWYLRMDIVWHKPNPMPESVTDRPTKAHEYIFLLSKSERYYYNADAIREPLATKTLTTFGTTRKRIELDGVGRVASHGLSRDVPTRKPKLDEHGEYAGANKRSVWTVATQPYDGAHFAVFPPKLIEPCIIAGSRPGDIVLDPFFGSGTTGMVAEKHERRWIGFDLSEKYAVLAKARTAQRTLVMHEATK
jgi:site-specific DNA-methyltransferase (cytosine-N4-specific)